LEQLRKKALKKNRAQNIECMELDFIVPHKPQDPYGTGKRDLVIMSFEK
jgi:hypothetical protein